MTKDTTGGTKFLAPVTTSELVRDSEFQQRQGKRKNVLPTVFDVLMYLYRHAVETTGIPPAEFRLTQRQFQMLNNQLKDHMVADPNPQSDGVLPPPSFNGVPIVIISEAQALLDQNTFGALRSIKER